MCRLWVGSKSAYSWVGILSLLMSRPTTCLLRELHSRTTNRLGSSSLWEVFNRTWQAQLQRACSVGSLQTVSYTISYLLSKCDGLEVGRTPHLLLWIFENFSIRSFSKFFCSFTSLTTPTWLLNPQTHFSHTAPHSNLEEKFKSFCKLWPRQLSFWHLNHPLLVLLIAISAGCPKALIHFSRWSWDWKNVQGTVYPLLIIGDFLSWIHPQIIRAWIKTQKFLWFTVKMHMLPCNYKGSHLRMMY